MRHSQSLPSVREVLVVSHRTPQLTLHRRHGEGWTEIQATGGQTIELSALAVRIAVDDVYAGGLEDVGS